MKCEHPGCDVEFEPRKGGRPQRFCSPEHSSGGRKRRYWEKNRERILAARKEKLPPKPEKVCARDGCGKTFIPVNRIDQVYCSVACRDKVYKTTDRYRAKEARLERGRRKQPHRQEYIRQYRRRGMTDAEFIAMHQAQEGRCAICGDQPDELVLDHCHDRAQNRALLCRFCNLGLGHFKDDPVRLQAAIRYLQQHTLTLV